MHREASASPTAVGLEATASAPQRLAGLDILRSLAIVSVVVYHAFVFHGLGEMPRWLEAAVKLGWMGVDLFFVLSGFLIGSQFLRPYLNEKTPLLWGFYRDRIFRILPAYFAVLALYLLVPDWREFPQMCPAWRFALMSENLIPDASMVGSFSHAWSLCVEMHFYLVFPLVVMGVMRRPSAGKVAGVIGALVVMGVLLRAYFLFHTVLPLLHSHKDYGLDYMAYIYYPTYSRLDGLLAGVALAVILSFRPRWWSRLTGHGNACLLTGLLLLCFSGWLYTNRWMPATPRAEAGVIVGPVVLSLAFACIILSVLSRNGAVARLRIPGTVQLAVLSYTLYLSHKALFHLVDRAFPALFDWNRFAWMAVYSLCCLACSTALYWSVERPFLRLRSRMRRAG